MRRFAALLALCCALAAAAAGPAGAKTWTVNDTGDGSGAVADGLCDAPGTETCTLREAIVEANADTDPPPGPGLPAVRITFALVGDLVIDILAPFGDRTQENEGKPDKTLPVSGETFLTMK